MSRDRYLEAFYKNRQPATIENISPYQHIPLDEQLGHPVSEGEIVAFNRDTENRGFVLPFDKYIGPGNSVNRGEPASEADAIAQEHDLRYFDAQYRYSVGEIDKATAEKEISDSDIVAINKFGSSGTLASVLGHDGLQIKHLVEKVVGQQYPNFGKDSKASFSSIAGKMVKTIIPSHQAWWDSLSKDRRTYVLNNPVYNHLFSDTEANTAITKQEAAATKEGFKRPGGIAPIFKQAKQARLGENSTNDKPGPSWQHLEPIEQVDGTVEDTAPVVSQSGSSTDKPTKTITAEPVRATQSNLPVQQIITGSSDIDIEMGLPGTGQGAGGAGDGNANSNMMIYEPERPNTNFGSKTSTYRKVHRFMTFAIAPTWISVDLTTPTENQRWLTTALAEVPWELPVLYMNQSEFDLLPSGSYVKQVRVKIIHRGNRIAFETGEVATRLATLNQIQNIMVGFGLNKTGWGVNSTYPSFDGTNPMKPTAITAPSYNTLDENFYGLSNADGNFANIIPTHQLGIPYPLPNYFTLANAVQNFGGVPPISENIRFMDGKTTIDKIVAEFVYNPKIAPLKPQLKHIRSGLPLMLSTGVALDVQVNGSIITGQTCRMFGTQSAGGANETHAQVSDTPTSNISSGLFTIHDPIEKSQWLKQGPWGQYQSPQIQPSVHVGVQAIPSLTSTGILSSIANWTDAQADWDVICEMDVVEYKPTKLPYATEGNVPAGDVLYHTNPSVPDEQTCTYAGLYTNNPIRVPPP